MAFRKSVADGWDIFKDTLKVLKKYPVLALPLFGAWIMMASVTLLFRYFDFSIYVFFLTIFIVTYSLSLACLMLLELMQQIESGQPTSLLRASHELISKNALKALPIALAWAILWFILLV